jgi:hypothetical protein
MTTRRTPSLSVCLGAGLVLILLAAACSAPPVKKPIVLHSFPPPYLPITPARTTIVPTSQFMKVAVLNFVDQTGKARAVAETMADMLATELHRSGRFEVYDRGQLRLMDVDFTAYVMETQRASATTANVAVAASAGGGELGGSNVPHREPASPASYMEYFLKSFEAIRAQTDALLLCAITSADGGRVEVDYRLINSQSFTVMVAGSATVVFRLGGDGTKVERDGIQDLAAEVRSSLPKPATGQLGRVMVQDGKVLTISLGRKDGIIPGMNVFVVAPGKTVAASSGAPASVDEMYLAQAYVVSVYDNTSQVVVYNGADYRVNDSVRFK